VSKLFSFIAAAVFVSSTFYGQQSNGRETSACPAPCAPKVDCPAPKPCPVPCPPPPCPKVECPPPRPCPPCPAPCPTPCPAPKPVCPAPCSAPKPVCPTPCPAPKPVCPTPCAAPVPCECLDRGLELPLDTNCFKPAYNAPANIFLKDCPWDVSVWADFIYWHVSEEGLFAARRLPTATTNGTLVEPHFKYKPGFKVGIGFNTDYDDWVVGLEYTWMHQKTHTHTSTATIDAPLSTLNWTIPNDVLFPIEQLSISTRWKMHFDRLDLTFARPYYQGKRLTVTPFSGLRGQWIRQSLKIDGEADLLGFLSFEDDVSVRSHSWAVGPVVGANTHYLLGCGFRFESIAAASILYTRYTSVRQSETLGTSSFKSSERHLGFLRPTAELGLGFGWGSYLCCQSYYVDFSARYDFHVLWDQNVMVEFVNAMNAVPGTNGNLYMHGLTLTLLFAF
jgi:hypothetical protein